MDVERSADVTLEQQAAVGSFRIAETLLHILPRRCHCAVKIAVAAMQYDYTTETRWPPDKENGCKDEGYAWTDKSPVP